MFEYFGRKNFDKAKVYARFYDGDNPQKGFDTLEEAVNCKNLCKQKPFPPIKLPHGKLKEPIILGCEEGVSFLAVFTKP